METEQVEGTNDHSCPKESEIQKKNSFDFKIKFAVEKREDENFKENNNLLCHKSEREGIIYFL